MNNSKLKLAVISLTLIFSTLTAAQNPSESDAARILMLEKALAAPNPEDVANQFAKANQDRNGAVQYMLFSDQLKKKYKDAWPYWVSGTSSPWITSYTIKKIKNEPKRSQFQIIYKWATAAGPFHPDMVQTIVIEPVLPNSNSSQKYWITKLSD